MNDLSLDGKSYNTKNMNLHASFPCLFILTTSFQLLIHNYINMYCYIRQLYYCYIALLHSVLSMHIICITFPSGCT